MWWCCLCRVLTETKLSSGLALCPCPSGRRISHRGLTPPLRLFLHGMRTVLVLQTGMTCSSSCLNGTPPNASRHASRCRTLGSKKKEGAASRPCLKAARSHTHPDELPTRTMAMPRWARGCGRRSALTPPVSPHPLRVVACRVAQTSVHPRARCRMRNVQNCDEKGRHVCVCVKGV